MKTMARRGDTTALVHRLRNVRPESVRRWGRMSAHQMVCHLADALRVAVGERVVKDRSTFLNRTLVKWVALYAPLPWPHGIATSAELDQVEGRGTPPGDFEEDVELAVGLMEDITAGLVPLGAARHPIFGPMSRAAWLRWGYLHADHHLRQFGV